MILFKKCRLCILTACGQLNDESMTLHDMIICLPHKNLSRSPPPQAMISFSMISLSARAIGPHYNAQNTLTKKEIAISIISSFS